MGRFGSGRGAGDLDDVLLLAIPAAGEPWARLGALARDWWDKARRPLPADQLRLGTRLREQASGDADEWAALDARLSAFALFAPPYRSGSVTHRTLTRAGGPLNLLRLAADQRDRSAVRAWLSDPQLKDIGAWVDSATRESGNADLIMGHMRAPFIERISAIVAVAGAIARRDDPAAAAPQRFDATIGLARSVAEALRAELPALRAAAATVRQPERALASAALTDLDELTGGELL